MKAASAHVLLTGASGGIGRAMTQALQASGAKVLGVGRAALSPLPAGMGWVQADLATEAGITAVAAAAAAARVNVCLLYTSDAADE